MLDLFLSLKLREGWFYVSHVDFAYVKTQIIKRIDFDRSLHGKRGTSVLHVVHTVDDLR